MEREKDVISRQ